MEERKYRIPRLWSNRELEKFSSLFGGKIVNVSGWKDIDKEGRKYKDYFTNADSYWITNYKPEAKGFQGDQENEIYLDLTKEIDPNLHESFDVVFNHTVLEHVFEVDIAFKNLCSLSKDIVILIVPFLQEQHAEYGDFWRFTPQAIDKLFQKNCLNTLYISFNEENQSSVYIFAVGSKKPELWQSIATMPGNKVGNIYNSNGFAGRNAIQNLLAFRILTKLKAYLRRE